MSQWLQEGLRTWICPPVSAEPGEINDQYPMIALVPWR